MYGHLIFVRANFRDIKFCDFLKIAKNLSVAQIKCNKVSSAAAKRLLAPK